MTWGFAYLLTPIALTSMTYYEVVALRFAIPIAMIPFVRRPTVGVAKLAGLAVCLFLGPYLLYTMGLETGVPGGIASVLGQSHIIFVSAAAWMLLGERPSWRSVAAAAIGLVGITIIIAPQSSDVPLLGAILLIASTIIWSVGNILMRKVPAGDLFPLVVWMSAMTSLPMLAFTAWATGFGQVMSKLMQSDVAVVGSILYLSVISTVAAYAAWAQVLSRNAAATVAPFLLIAPFVSVVAAAAITGEQFSPLRMTGIGCVLAALALSSLTRKTAESQARVLRSQKAAS